MPQDAIDPVNAAAQIVLSLNTIVGRMVDNPNSPVIIGVSAMNGGDASNVRFFSLSLSLATTAPSLVSSSHVMSEMYSALTAGICDLYPGRTDYSRGG